MRPLALAASLVALLALPADGQPVVDTMHGGAGVVRQGEVDDIEDAPLVVPSGCLPAFWDMTLRLVAVAWVPGDVLTLRAFDASTGQAVSAATEGTPPVATLHYTSVSSCPRFFVEGTQVAAAAAYVVEQDPL